MKHVILLFTMAVFTVTAVSSCSSYRCDYRDLPIKPVMIKTKGADARGNKPEAVPVCVALKYGTDQEVKWEIDREDLGFTVRFKNGESPFRTHEFTKVKNRSGRATADPREKKRIYKYSIKVDGLDELDPIVIIWK